MLSRNLLLQEPQVWGVLQFNEHDRLIMGMHSGMF